MRTVVCSDCGKPEEVYRGLKILDLTSSCCKGRMRGWKRKFVCGCGWSGKEEAWYYEHTCSGHEARRSPPTPENILLGAGGPPMAGAPQVRGR